PSGVGKTVGGGTIAAPDRSGSFSQLAGAAHVPLRLRFAQRHCRKLPPRVVSASRLAPIASKVPRYWTMLLPDLRELLAVFNVPVTCTAQAGPRTISPSLAPSNVVERASTMLLNDKVWFGPALIETDPPLAPV